jgi:hypothetical protein
MVFFGQLALLSIMNSILPKPVTIQYLGRYSGVYFLGAPEGLRKDPRHVCSCISGGTFNYHPIQGLPTFSIHLFADLDE